MNRSRQLATITGGSILLSAGLLLLFLYAVTTVQPGGPACVPQSPCPVSPWYDSSTQSLELGVGLASFASGVGLLTLYVITQRRQRLHRSLSSP